ncbi:retropepsin-like aspartic protease [Marinirhabdus gelatinilytica]|uniref:retropepsin-like aspartic protease n=1 Tax=Marinirhabdus gelatinilytica TaxID=1703343 RepID=UPI000E0FA569|nr:retropepsin-like aspartic protease [Marinirhabdus gelatinilytica]
MATLRTLLEASGFYRIFLTKLATGHYKFSARINGIDGSFILDTGASTSCVGLDRILQFSLFNEASEIKAAGAGATNMETQIARNNLFEIGKLKLSTTDFVLFDLSHVNLALSQAEEAPIDGIIGADVLKKYRAVIDYGRNCLYLKR